MTATVLVQFLIKDPEKFKAYGAAAGQTIAAVGGEIVGRYRNGGTLAGEFGHNGFALIQFPDVETAKSWHESADYQALVELRNQAADMTLVLGEPL